jgi:hypothetical protein
MKKYGQKLISKGISVRSGCRAGDTACRNACIANRDMRSLDCFFRGWPSDDSLCVRSQEILNNCLTECNRPK